jgi:MtaA/CmuA family methyltransferase
VTKKQQFDSLLKTGITGGNIPFHPILMHFAARLSGKTYGEFAADHHVLVESNIRCLEHFNLDWVELISDPYRETSAFGAGIEYRPEGVPKCLDTLVRTLDDVYKLKNPDIYKSARTLDRIKGAELYQKLLKGTVPVFGWIEGPLAEACDLAGVSEMLMWLMTDPDFSNRLMDKCMVTARDFARAQIEAGCDVIGIGDAICSQIDLELYNLYVRNRHQELINYIHSIGGLVKLHICGNITHLLPSLKDIGIDILDLDWQVDLEDAHRIMGDAVILCGNINPVTIQNATAGDLEQITRELLKKERNSRFILSGGCEITVNTPPGNILAMKKALRVN